MIFRHNSGTVKTFTKNRGTNETTKSAEKSSVSPKRVAASPSSSANGGKGMECRGKRWVCYDFQCDSVEGRDQEVNKFRGHREEGMTILLTP